MTYTKRVYVTSLTFVQEPELDEDDSRLTPAEDDDTAGHKIDRKEFLLLIGD